LVSPKNGTGKHAQDPRDIDFIPRRRRCARQPDVQHPPMTSDPQALDQPAEAPTPPSSLAGPALAGLWLALGAALAAAGPVLARPLTFAFVMTGWVLALALHEFGHAFTGWLAGDRTVVAKGYLTLDPRRYTDLGTSLVIPLVALALGGIGFPGGAVWLREDLMRGRLWRAAASLAGPAMTLLALIALSGLVRLATPLLPGGADNPLVPALAFLGFLQAMALVLNLLPLPGLDGFGAIRPFLPERLRQAARRLEGPAFLILFLLVFVLPGATRDLFAFASWIAAALGLPLDAAQAGYGAFRFWG
jgi:Zn-dependent protease